MYIRFVIFTSTFLLYQCELPYYVIFLLFGSSIILQISSKNKHIFLLFYAFLLFSVIIIYSGKLTLLTLGGLQIMNKKNVINTPATHSVSSDSSSARRKTEVSAQITLSDSILTGAIVEYRKAGYNFIRHMHTNIEIYRILS